MQIARDPFALGKPRFEAITHLSRELPHVHPVQRNQDTQACEHA